jgi:hypothetical protein
MINKRDGMFDKEELKGIAMIAGVVIIVVILLVGALFGFLVIGKHYRVWSMEMEGKGILLQANYERQAIVAQAQAERDSATLRAEAIGIVGQAAQDFPEYRNQEFIGAFAKAMETGRISQIIYVPTEANIPIMEAGKR